jgi:hypothetical protein
MGGPGGIDYRIDQQFYDERVAFRACFVEVARCIFQYTRPSAGGAGGAIYVAAGVEIALGRLAVQDTSFIFCSVTGHAGGAVFTQILQINLVRCCFSRCYATAGQGIAGQEGLGQGIAVDFYFHGGNHEIQFNSILFHHMGKNTQDVVVGQGGALDFLTLAEGGTQPGFDSYTALSNFTSCGALDPRYGVVQFHVVRRGALDPRYGGAILR